MTNIVLFSYDVLANSQHRQDLKNESWDDFHANHVDDEPNAEMIDLLNILSEHYSIFVYSDTPETHRQSMTEWFVDNDAHVEEILLASSFARGTLVAKRLEIIRDGVDLAEVSFVFENNVSVIEALRDEGATVFECL